MTITDRTRKILWGRSGNRCAFCRAHSVALLVGATETDDDSVVAEECHRELLVGATETDDDSVVAEECHIVSGKPRGSRYDPTFPAERLDDQDNLILLCSVHHKMVDDQPATYTVESLQKLKRDHEQWVASALSKSKVPRQPSLRRTEENVPSQLLRLTTGQDVMRTLSGSYSLEFGYDDPQSDMEAELLHEFAQEIEDWDDLSPSEEVRAVHRMNMLLQQLEDAGFRVFGDREVQHLEGSPNSPLPWLVAMVRIVRSANPDIVRVGIGAGEEAKEAEAAKGTSEKHDLNACGKAD